MSFQWIGVKWTTVYISESNSLIPSKDEYGVAVGSISEFESKTVVVVIGRILS